VIGKDFPEPLLAAVAELANDDLQAALAHLQRAEFSTSNRSIRWRNTPSSTR